MAGSPGGTASGGEIRNSAGIESSRSNKVFRLDLLSELYLLSDFVADRLDDDSFKRDSGLRLDPGTPLALLSECFGLPKAGEFGTRCGQRARVFPPFMLPLRI